MKKSKGISTALAAAAVVVVIAVAGVAYYVSVQGTQAVNTSSPSLTTSRSSSSSSAFIISSSSSSATSSASQTSSTSTATTPLATSTTSSTSLILSSQSSSTAQAFCGTPAQGATTVPVSMPGLTKPFSPQIVTVVIGVNNTVVWTNDDPAMIDHTVTSNTGGNNPLFTSGNMPPSHTFTCTFTNPGSYLYRCVYHAAMTGQVIVKSP